jgi:hypothetical protein
VPRPGLSGAASRSARRGRGSGPAPSPAAGPGRSSGKQRRHAGTRQILVLASGTSPSVPTWSASSAVHKGQGHTMTGPLAWPVRGATGKHAGNRITHRSPDCSIPSTGRPRDNGNCCEIVPRSFA